MFSPRSLLLLRLTRPPVHRLFSSSLPRTTPFVPPASLHDVDDDHQPTKSRPPTPTFYTTRSDYYDVFGGLQDAINTTRSTLKSLHLYPLPKFALDALPPALPAWADRADMGTELNVKLSAGMYRNLIVSLKQLELYHRIAKTAGITELASELADILSAFESTRQVEARERRLSKLATVGKTHASLDAYGRSYTLGRRKTSTARVWMIRAKTGQVEGEPEQEASTSATTLLAPVVKASAPPTSSILINSAPIADYFPLPADREAVLRPLKLAGLLGAFNIFALVRGGGTSGQSGAVALAISRACVAHVPEVETILRKANLMKRDPRMVERKKTGLAKARKAYTWVKR